MNIDEYRPQSYIKQDIIGVKLFIYILKISINLFFLHDF